MSFIDPTTGTAQMFQPEVVTFGETMGCMIPTSAKGIEYSPYMHLLFGGAESNVAIGLSRLGHRAGWFSLLGSDPIGRKIFKAVRGEGVDVSRVRWTTEANTGLMLREIVSGRTSVYYYRRLSAASLLQPADLDEEYIKQARILHVTGITPALSDSCRETAFAAMRMARRHGVKVCFDPNLRLKLWRLEEARNVLLAMAEEADYFLPGLDELKLLYETEDFDRILKRLNRLSAVSVIKGGDRESLLVEHGVVTSVPYFHVPEEKIVDPVGAGDGFCAGFISGLLKGYTHEEAVRLGNLVGSMVIQFEGDWEGAPTWDQVQAVLNNAKHIER